MRLKTMAINTPDVIDGMGIDESSNTLVLLMIDSAKWYDEYRHLKAIQKKMNSYVRFIDKKGYKANYGDKDFTGYRIELYFKYNFSSACRSFLESGRAQLKQRNIDLIYNKR